MYLYDAHTIEMRAVIPLPPPVPHLFLQHKRSTGSSNTGRTEDREEKERGDFRKTLITDATGSRTTSLSVHHFVTLFPSFPHRINMRASPDPDLRDVFKLLYADDDDADWAMSDEENEVS
jgi:hypothetical protein